jgi:hypothetical protein
MADFAQVNTSRYKVRYSVRGHAHDMVFRYGLPTLPPPASLIVDVGAFLTALANMRFSDWTILGESFALKNQTFFSPLPLTLTTDAGAVVGGLQPSEAACFGSFVGLSTDANPTRIMVFGLNIQANNAAKADFRLTGGEQAEVAAALAVLNTMADYVAIDENPARWHQYMNWKYHDHYVKIARG